VDLQQHSAAALPIVQNALGETSRALLELFGRAWHSTSMHECPALAEWRSVLRALTAPTPQPFPAIAAQPIAGRGGFSWEPMPSTTQTEPEWVPLTPTHRAPESQFVWNTNVSPRS